MNKKTNLLLVFFYSLLPCQRSGVLKGILVMKKREKSQLSGNKKSTHPCENCRGFLLGFFHLNFFGCCLTFKVEKDLTGSVLVSFFTSWKPAILTHVHCTINQRIWGLRYILFYGTFISFFHPKCLKIEANPSTELLEEPTKQKQKWKQN